MKKIILMFLIYFLSVNTHAAPLDSKNLDNLTMLKLNDIQENHLLVIVQYPGKNISGSCNIVIRSRHNDAHNETLIKLAERFQFEQYVSQIPVTPNSSSKAALIFSLQEGLFLDGIDIKTKDGKSISENIASVLPHNKSASNDIAIFAGVCA